jgi:hypothetical protein
LARVESSRHLPLPELLHQQGHGLGWGTTVVVITGSVTPALAPALTTLKRHGYTVLVLLAGGRRLGAAETVIPPTIPLYRIREERELPAVAEVFRG